MSTRQNGSGAPEPSAPWNEIAPGLWLGGLHRTDAAGRRLPVVVDAEFDLVVSLCAAAGHGPAPGRPHRVLALPDGPLDAWQLTAVQSLSRTVAEAVVSGQSVLVRGRTGRNRSALVAAQALVELGSAPDEAVRLVRERRSPLALRDGLLVDYLATGLETARLLAALSPPPP
ncbi:protein phosphatase [Kitasatospora sp. NPDC088391]|uniref:protein-tyrosine phosphatase family protein n=1 Tax=Kitasatospora sp. NPDC088391 TaxID=3364074 RepID=UPI0038171E01